MSRAAALHWFPTPCPDIPVKFVLGIGKLNSPRESSENSCTARQAAKRAKSEPPKTKSHESAKKDACFLVPHGLRAVRENKTEIQISIPQWVINDLLLCYLGKNTILDLVPDKEILLLNTDMLNIPNLCVNAISHWD